MGDDEADDTKSALATFGAGAAAHELYKDALQPAARELSKPLLATAKLVTLALAPIELVVWGFDQVRAWLVPELAERLEHVPPHKVQTPEPYVAGQILMQLPLCAHQAELRRLYANLLAAAMHVDAAPNVHPAFVQVVQQLTPDEALVLGSARKSSEDFVLREEQSHVSRAQPRAPNMFGVEVVTGNVFGLYDHSHAHMSYETVSTQFRKLCVYAGVAKPELSDAYLDNLIRLRIFSDLAWNESELHPDSSFGYGPGIDGSRLENKTGRVIELSEFGKRFLAACMGEAQRRQP